MDSVISGYAYIATSDGLPKSYVGVSASLLDMEWIAKYGVDHLVWFEGFSDIALAQVRADELRGMSEDQRRSLILKGNPTQADLSSRIWGSEDKRHNVCFPPIATVRIPMLMRVSPLRSCHFQEGVKRQT